MFKRVLLLLLLLCMTLASSAWAASFPVSGIVVEGNERVHTADILNAISIKPGQSVTPDEIDAAMAEIFKMQRFSDVAAEIVDDSGRMVLKFKVEERPLVRKIRFEGNEKLESDKLRTALTFRVPSIYDQFEISKSVDAIKAQYAQEGYYAAEVSADSHVSEDNESLVTFRIEEGHLVRIKSIRFDGNTVFDDDDLQEAMLTKEKWFLSWITARGNYNELQLQQDLERLADLYFNQGYVMVKVHKPVISLVDDDKHMLLLIQIDEGPQFNVANIDIQGDLIGDKQQVLDMIELAPGDVFSREKLRNGVNAITDFYSDRGFAYANIAPLSNLDKEKLTINLMIDIEKGPEVTVERINISGNVRTRDKVIRREMKLVEGDLFNASLLKRSKSRINNLGYFEAVDITTSEGSDNQHMNVDVTVKERRTGTFSIGGGYSSVDGFVAQGSITQENFLGKGWRLNLAASLSDNNNTYQIGLLDPYFLDTEWTVGFELYQTQHDYSDYTIDANGMAIKAGHPIGEYSRFLSVYRLETKDIYDVTPGSLLESEEGESTLSSVTTSFFYNTTNDRLDPSVGTDFVVSWEIAGLGGTEYFSKYDVDIRRYWPMPWETVFMAHGSIGFVHSLNSDDVSLDERYFLGGIRTLRGFEDREVGPQNADGDYVGGEAAAYSNLEYIFPLYKPAKLKGVVFFDVGNAWSKDESMFSDWRYATGAGIRWLSPLGPMRFEYGINLDARDGEDTGVFDFTIGRFF